MDKPSQGNTTVDVDAEADKQSTIDILSKHKRRGRPPGSKNKTSPTQGKTGNVADPETVRQNLSLVRQTTQSLVGAVDGIVCRRIARKAKALEAPEEFVNQIWADVGLTKSEVQVVSECTATIVGRHDILMKYAPECMLVCVMSSYAIRVGTVMRKLDLMLKEKHKTSKADESPAQES